MFTLKRKYPRTMFMAARSAAGAFKKPVTLNGMIYYPIPDHEGGCLKPGPVTVSLDTFTRITLPMGA